MLIASCCQSASEVRPPAAQAYITVYHLPRASGCACADAIGALSQRGENAVCDAIADDTGLLLCFGRVGGYEEERVAGGGICDADHGIDARVPENTRRVLVAKAEPAECAR